MRVVVRIASVTLGLAYLGLLVSVRSIGSWSDGSGSSGSNLPGGIVGALPIGVFCSMLLERPFGKNRSRMVLAAGILAHVILAAFVTVICFVGTTGVLFLIGSLLPAFLWVMMYLSLSERTDFQQ